MKKGTFGEPWKRGEGQQEFIIYANGWSVLRRGTAIDDKNWLQISNRAVTCANACDGIENPQEFVPDALSLIRRMLGDCNAEERMESKKVARGFLIKYAQ